MIAGESVYIICGEVLLCIVKYINKAVKRYVMDAFTITIIIIIVTTLIASYIRRITKDKCLKSFEGFTVTIELADRSKYCGKLEVESTGLEVIFREQMNENDIPKMSHIIYKEEFAGLFGVFRYHDELTKRGVERRTAALKKTYHPTAVRRMKRRIANFFKLVKDSMIEIANTLSGKLKTTSAGSVLTGNEKYTTKLNQELVNTIDASYDPLLEKYIGNIVVVFIKHPEGLLKLRGVLKEYTQNYVELLDVDYIDGRKCDTVFPRRVCDVRGLGESSRHYSIFSFDFEIKKYKKFFAKINIMKRKNDG